MTQPNTKPRKHKEKKTRMQTEINETGVIFY